jgi:hypothetical protein
MDSVKKENFYLEAMEQVDCFVVSDHAYSANLPTQHTFESQATRQGKDHIFKLMCDPRSEEEVEAIEPIVQEAWWAPGPVWTCVKNLSPTRIRSPDPPAHS